MLTYTKYILLFLIMRDEYLCRSDNVWVGVLCVERHAGVGGQRCKIHTETGDRNRQQHMFLSEWTYLHIYLEMYQPNSFSSCSPSCALLRQSTCPATSPSLTTRMESFKVCLFYSLGFIYVYAYCVGMSKCPPPSLHLASFWIILLLL